MTISNWLRFSKDVEYDLLVPPYGQDYYSMTSKQVKENYEWFISKIPERVAYLTNRCSNDLNISIEKFDLSPESLVYVWRWFLKTAKIEKTPKDQIEKMERTHGQFGEHWIDREQFSVATQFILRDIGMYLGEVFTNTYSTVKWGYFVKPKSEISAKRPVLFGFFIKKESPPFSLPLEPIRSAEREANKLFKQVQNLYNKKPKETDLYDFFKSCEKEIYDEIPAIVGGAVNCVIQ